MKKNNKNNNNKKPTGGFNDMPIVQPDKKQEKSGVSLPKDANVDEARDWVNFNKK